MDFIEKSSDLRNQKNSSKWTFVLLNVTKKMPLHLKTSMLSCILLTAASMTFAFGIIYVGHFLWQITPEEVASKLQSCNRPSCLLLEAGPKNAAVLMFVGSSFFLLGGLAPFYLAFKRDKTIMVISKTVCEFRGVGPSKVYKLYEPGSFKITGRCVFKSFSAEIVNGKKQEHRGIAFWMLDRRSKQAAIDLVSLSK